MESQNDVENIVSGVSFQEKNKIEDIWLPFRWLNHSMGAG